MENTKMNDTKMNEEKLEKLKVLRYRKNQAGHKIRAIKRLPERGEEMLVTDGYYKIPVPDEYRKGILSLLEEYYTKEFEKWEAKFENMEID